MSRKYQAAIDDKLISKTINHIREENNMPQHKDIISRQHSEYHNISGSVNTNQSKKVGSSQNNNRSTAMHHQNNIAMD